MADAIHRLKEGWVLHQAGRLKDANQVYLEVLKADPKSAAGWCYLGMLMDDAGQPTKAVDAYRRGVRCDPKLPQLHNNLGNALRALGRPDEAEASFARALEIDPEYASAHMNRGLALLQLGRWEEGWMEFRWRHRRLKIGRDLGGKRWEGESLDGKTIYLEPEQGIGDTVQFVRYAGALKRRFDCRVIVGCPPRLVRLLGRYPEADGVVSNVKHPPRFDVRSTLMEVPALVGERVETVDRKVVPYLSAEPDKVAFWKNRMSGLEGLRVGVGWRGNPANRTDRYRSFGLKMVAEALGEISGVRWVNLQVGGESEVESSGLTMACWDDLDGEGRAFVDTAAVVSQLDLVISADTALAHVAGALGVPVWLPLCLYSDWRWLMRRRDTVWYPKMRLFRQEKLGVWSPVFEEIGRELQEMIRK